MRKLIFGILCLGLLYGCSNDKVYLEEFNVIQNNINKLKTSFDNDEGKYDQLLTYYVSKGKELTPDAAEVIDSFAIAGTSESARIKQLQNELDELKAGYKKQKKQELIGNIDRLKSAATLDVQDILLVDEINTIAALAGDGLNSIETDQALENDGAALVGNPAYGRWESRNGTSVWTWLAIYSMWNNVRYDSWYYNRPYSYQYDYYNSHYGSSNWRRNENSRYSYNKQAIDKTGQELGRKPSSYSMRNNTKVPQKVATDTNIRKSSSYTSQRSSNLSNRRAVNSYTPSSNRRTSSYSSRPSSSSLRSSSRSSSSFGGK